MRTNTVTFTLLLLLTACAASVPTLRAQTGTDRVSPLSAGTPARSDPHNDPQWPEIARHLPDQATATPATLELQADVLRARRFPEDALDYYNYALRRGGNQERLLKKIGVTELELHNETLARLYFAKALKLRSKDSEAWNNMGAVEFLQRRYLDSVHDYKRALKLARSNAVYHSNLGITYFQMKDFDSARKEMTIAVKLDPLLFQRTGSTGISAQLLTPEDHGRFCFEMARAYARMKNEEAMLQELATASESGFDVMYAMGQDQVLAKYRSDPRVLLLVRVAKTMRAGRMAPANVAGTVPPLPPPMPAAH